MVSQGMRRWFLSAAFIIPFLVYLFTLAPTVTNEDSGDLITSSYILGIPHPPGYPLYTMLGKLFTYIPVGSIAWRVNLMSAFFASLAVSLFFLLLLDFFTPTTALISSFIFAFSREFWSQSVIAEVYTLHLFFLVLLLYLSFRLLEKPSSRIFLFTWFIMGLSLANHHTALLFLPFLAWVTFRIWKHLSGKGKAFFLLMFSLGLLPYLYLPLRSRANPPLDWGNPENLKNFLRVITRYQYGGFSFNDWGWKYLQFHLAKYGKLLFMQFSFLSLLALGLLKIVKKPGVKRIFLIYFFLTYSLLYVFLVALNPYIRHPSVHVGVFYIPSFLAFSYFIGEGLSFLQEKEKRLLPLFLSLPFILLWINYPYCNRHKDFSSYQYGIKVLSLLPEKSIVFTDHKDSIFIFWYLQFVEGKRKDVVFLSVESLKRPVYLKRMRKLYPRVKFPDEEEVKGFVKETIEKKYPPETIVYMIIESIIEKNLPEFPIYSNLVFPQRKFVFSTVPPIYRILPK